MKDTIVTLKYPFTIADSDGENGVREIKELKFSRLKAKHMKAIPDSFYEKEGENMNVSEMLPLLCSICSLPENGLDDLDIEDFGEVAKMLQDFMGNSLKTGGK